MIERLILAIVGVLVIALFVSLANDSFKKQQDPEPSETTVTQEIRFN